MFYYVLLFYFICIVTFVMLNCLIVLFVRNSSDPKGKFPFYAFIMIIKFFCICTQRDCAQTKKEVGLARW